MLVDIRERRLPLRRVSLADLKGDLESVLGEYLSFHWIGRFADLCEGRGEFASDVAGQFLGDDGDDASSPAVSPERRSDFIEFLRARYDGERLLVAAGKWPCVMPEVGIYFRNTYVETAA